MESITLLELTNFLRQVVALNFPETLWVTAEIGAANVVRSHTYLDLWQKDAQSDDIVAQTKAMLWAADRTRLQKTHGTVLKELLQPGVAVRLEVAVTYHPKYGLSLMIQDIDPVWTFGQLAMQRAATLSRLRAEGLLEKNRNQALPTVVQRIALISSETAAGLKDFLSHLGENQWGYCFTSTLFSSAMQGIAVVDDIRRALEQIAARRKSFDAVVIIRGGGGKGDLSVFDQYELCKAVAQCPLPVFTGIGHQIDESLLDMVAHTAQKTPTAVADFILNHNLAFESNLLAVASGIFQKAQQGVQLHQNALQYTEFSLQQAQAASMSRFVGDLRNMETQIKAASQAALRRQESQLQQTAQLIAALSPDKVLQRGYSLTIKQGKVVNDPSMVASGDRITTRTSGGEFDSEVR